MLLINPLFIKALAIRSTPDFCPGIILTEAVIFEETGLGFYVVLAIFGLSVDEGEFVFVGDWIVGFSVFVG